jgi:hypothetical protein
MVEEALTERKIDNSITFAQELMRRDAPLLAAFWDIREEWQRWVLVLVPITPGDERRLTGIASSLSIEPPYRTIFSISDPIVDSRQIDRVRALGAYIRVEPYVGRRIGPTFTGGHYFEGAVPVYLAPELVTNLVA